MIDTPAAQIQHWDTWNSNYRQLETLDEPSKRRAHEIVSALRKRKVQGASILEVGCGTGWLSTRLTEFGEVTAIDLGKEIIEVAKTRNPEIQFLSGDIHQVDLALEHFDVIVTLETFSHVPDQPAFLSRLASLLKPGGLLLLTTQNKSVFTRRADVKPAVGYIRQWVDMKTLKELLRPSFAIRRATTLEPEGHLGLLRLVNSRKVNSAFSRLVGARRVKRWKEGAGFGQTIFVTANRR